MKRLTLLLLLLVACTPGGPDPYVPAPKAERNYDRAQAFDILPRNLIDAVPWDGPCDFIVPVYGLDVGEPIRPGIDTTDTVRLDLWISTRCPGPWGVYDELTFYLDTRHPSFSESLKMTVWWGRDTLEQKRVILHQSVSGRVPEPYAWCYSPPAWRVIARSPGLPIDAFVTCTKAGEPDSLRLVLEIEPPVFRKLACGPLPIVLVVELLDVEGGVLVSEPLLFTVCSR